MDILKKDMGIKSNVNYRIPMFNEYQCKSCGGKGTIKILEYAKPNEIEFKCDNCSHTVKEVDYTDLTYVLVDMQKSEIKEVSEYGKKLMKEMNGVSQRTCLKKLKILCMRMKLMKMGKKIL